MSETTPVETTPRAAQERPPEQQQQQGQGQDRATPNITFTFPIVFVTGPPPSQPSSGSDSTTSTDESTDGSTDQPRHHHHHHHHHHVPPEAVQNFIAQFIRSMPLPFGGADGQFEPIPNGPPKKHATQSALEKLKPVNVTDLAEQDRRCHICMQDYYVPPVGPRSPYVEDVKDEEDYGVEDGGKDAIPEPVESSSSKDVGELPLQMPCGHVFGSTCLKEWLYQSPTCPLCRVEVESYTDEPQPMPGFATPFPFPVPPNTMATEQSDEMQVDPSEGGESQQLPFPQLAFQFIFTTPVNPPSPDMPNTTPSPSTSRPSSARGARHHPYARAPTPSPLATATPIISSSLPAPPSVTDRPDLFCAQRISGLCSHDDSDDNLTRLECGHGFHADCIAESMAIEGYPITEDERRCPRCRRWTHVIR